MCSKNNIIHKSLTLVVTSVPMAAFAHLNIVTSEGRVEEINPLSMDATIYKQVVDVGNKKFINHPVKSFANDLPLGLALPSIVPRDWVIDISDKLSGFPVSWEKVGNWDDVIVEISKRHNLVVVFDWNRHILQMKTNDAEMLDLFHTKSDTKVVRSVDQPYNPMVPDKNKNAPDSANQPIKPSVSFDGVQSVTNSLVKCSDSPNDDCTSPKVDIEKLVLDTDWLDNETHHLTDEPVLNTSTTIKNAPNAFSNHVTPDEVPIQEELEDLKTLKLAIEKDKKMKADYRSAHVLHGDGSYEDFVNGGGAILNADPEVSYVYVFKRGKLFSTINKWAELNGFHVENDIFTDKKVDYPNAQDIKIKGTFKDVVTLLLNKYRKAEVPVNHRYYIGGGSSTLHIFESKFESLYVN